MAAALLYCNALQTLLNWVKIKSQFFLSKPMSGDGETAGEVFMSTKKTGTATSRKTPKTGLKTGCGGLRGFGMAN